jgi:hypothetical protein
MNVSGGMRREGHEGGANILVSRGPCSLARRGEDAGEAMAAAREVREYIVGEEGEVCDLGDGRVALDGCSVFR